MHDQLCSCVTCLESSSYLIFNNTRPPRTRSFTRILRRAISSLRTRPGLLTMTRDGKMARVPRV